MFDQVYRALQQGGYLQPYQCLGGHLLVTLVNWCELTVTDERTGQMLYHNALITHHRLNDDTVVQGVAAGRSRWKTENENHHVLKTQGYHLEHN